MKTEIEPLSFQRWFYGKDFLTVQIRFVDVAKTEPFHQTTVFNDILLTEKDTIVVLVVEENVQHVPAEFSSVEKTLPIEIERGLRGIESREMKDDIVVIVQPWIEMRTKERLRKDSIE